MRAARCLAPELWMVFDALPLANWGMAWIVPAIVGAALGAGFSLVRMGTM